MTYDEALAFWYGRVNYERKVPQPGDLKLDRMRALLQRLGNPHEQLKTVHVAGSKGKGSTCAMLASVLMNADYRVGLFTSPHLTDVRERIQVDSKLIGRDELAALMTEIKPAVEELEAAGEPPTFFEVGTAVGFLYFLRQRCDIAVIEVGLGGRFDSTNVLTPLVSVITSISLDHTQMLGETVEQIAFEKAGIIKPGVPVVSGVTDPAARAVIERVAAERGARLAELGEKVRYEHDAWPWDGEECRSMLWMTTEHGEWPPLVLKLSGAHQAENAAIVVLTAESLRDQGVAVSTEAVEFGLACVRWPGRFEVFPAKPLAVLDCAHSVASAKVLVDALASYFGARRVMDLIFAVSADKDVPGMFRVLAPHFRRFYLTRYQQSTRAVPPEQLAEMLPPDVERVVCATPAEAWHAAVADATPETLVVIAGSVFLAGELRPLLVEASKAEP